LSWPIVISAGLHLCGELVERGEKGKKPGKRRERTAGGTGVSAFFSSPACSRPQTERTTRKKGGKEKKRVMRGKKGTPPPPPPF